MQQIEPKQKYRIYINLDKAEQIFWSSPAAITLGCFLIVGFAVFVLLGAHASDIARIFKPVQ